MDEDMHMFYSMIAGDVSGASTNTRLQASPDREAAYSHAVRSSRDFHAVVNDSNASYDAVLSALKVKTSAAINFENLFGVKWPL